jgi:hypothetical protein
MGCPQRRESPHRAGEDAALPKEKSRPENNFHCFEGVGLQFWRAMAQGHSPSPDLMRGPDGAWWELKQDIDGYALQNGGMVHIQETKLNPDSYFRFFGTIAHNLHGAKGGMTGGWWIDYENLQKVLNFAEKCDYSLARAAGMLLVIPKEWHDCGYLGCALLQKQMKAFVGKGKPAAGRISPASAMRDPSINPATMSPANLEVKQYFVPGSRLEIAAAFDFKWVKHVIKPGVPIF